MDMFIQTNNMNWQPSTVNAQQEEGVKYNLTPIFSHHLHGVGAVLLSVQSLDRLELSWVLPNGEVFLSVSSQWIPEETTVRIWIYISLYVWLHCHWLVCLHCHWLFSNYNNMDYNTKKDVFGGIKGYRNVNANQKRKINGYFYSARMH